MTNYENELKTKNLKVTPQRVAILKEIESSGHISIEDIYDRIKKTYPSISLATVYKNINTMQDAHILRSVKAPSQKQKFELCDDKHVHVSCQKCGRLEDVRLDMSEVMKTCANETGYDIYDVSTIFIGICPECKKELP
ncbi:transcriptional repressor [Helicobacter sp. 13S00401-1]|nr:transcriptional repressor [Helicobacter sp. 13S00401-1]